MKSLAPAHTEDAAAGAPIEAEGRSAMMTPAKVDRATGPATLRTGSRPLGLEFEPLIAAASSGRTCMPIHRD